MEKIKAEIIADSINPQGDRITTYLLTFPRFILAELNTHRVFSKNSASSRAIPFNKMVKMVEEDPFIPIAWQKDHKGMQGGEYITDSDMIEYREDLWLEASFKSIEMAKRLNYNIPNFDGKIPEGEDREGVTKQLCNRLLEPFMWHTVLLTGTEFENFFSLRCPQYEVPYTWDEVTKVFKSRKDAIKYWQDKADIDPSIGKPKDISDLEWLKLNKGQAEIHMQALAEAMWDAYNESIPKKLQAGEWHIPFGDKIDYALDKWNFLPNTIELWGKDMSEYGIKISTARCARLSYMTFDGEIDYEKDLKLHDSLLESRHASPFEHCCRALTEEEYNILGKMVLHPENGYVFENGWVDNFKGFISYRRLLNI